MYVSIIVKHIEESANSITHL